MYRSLDPVKIIATLERLERRIGERFPGAGLERVCAELTQVARESTARAEQLSRPNLVIRLMSGVIIAAGVAVLAYVATHIEVRRDAESVFSVLQGIEALMNTTVLVGAAVLFLVTLESRWKRRQALHDLHELRSIVHVIDMHQLTKDPSSVASESSSTPSSPERSFDPQQLTRYLDYCSEMLSLSAKVAALYAQCSRDPLLIETASDLGQITANLSNKIWQKINIVQQTMN